MSAATPGQAAREQLEERVRQAIASAGRCTAKPGTCSSCDGEVSDVMEIADHYAEAAQEPKAAPGASAPDHPAAKFRVWMDSRGYDDSNSFDGDYMAEAFEAGITAAVVAYSARPGRAPQPAPELADQRPASMLRPVDFDEEPETEPPHKPRPAPELAAADRRVREGLDAIRTLCEARLRAVGMVDGKGVARKVIAIIDKTEGK